MGIKDLLPSLADITQKEFSLSELKGKRVAIDASGKCSTNILTHINESLCYYWLWIAWLHKAIFATAEESLDLDFEEHLLYVDFLITRTRNFRLCGVEPVLVFDGKRSILKVRVILLSNICLLSALCWPDLLCICMFLVSYKCEEGWRSMHEHGARTSVTG